MVRKIEFPRIVVVDKGSIAEVGEVTKELSSGDNVLLVSNDQLMKIVGNQIKQTLTDSGFNVSYVSAEIANESTVKKAQDSIKENKANIALGAGGGTCIDVAKLSAFRENIPFISIPTAASHDGLTSPVASLHENTVLKSMQARAPVAVIADTEIIANAPAKMFPAGCGDLISNYTAVADWKLARDEKQEYYGDYAAGVSLLSAQMILDNLDKVAKKDFEGTKIAMESLISSGAAMCITGSSRPCSGSDHQFSHALDKFSPVHALHGEQCGVGAILMAKLHNLEWEKFRDALKQIGAPVTAQELGIESKYIIEALVKAPTIRDRYTILTKNPLDEKSAEELAKETGVI